MKKQWLVLTLAALLVFLCACSPEAPAISTQPVSDGTTAPQLIKPTRPAPGSRMTLADLMGEMGATMHWSVMQVYEHTQQDAVSAVFPVSDGNGKEATLLVAFDEAADLLTQATLTYGDVSINILTDDTMVIRNIMLAMDEG